MYINYASIKLFQKVKESKERTKEKKFEKTEKTRRMMENVACDEKTE